MAHGSGMKLSRRRRMEVTRKLGVLPPADTASWLKVLCVLVAFTLVVKEWVTHSVPEEVYRPTSKEALLDLARFSAYWRTNFNTPDVDDGHNAVLRRSDDDVTIMSDGVVQKPFITGSPPGNAFFARIRRALVYNNQVFAKESGYEFVPNDGYVQIPKSSASSQRLYPKSKRTLARGVEQCFDDGEC